MVGGCCMDFVPHSFRRTVLFSLHRAQMFFIFIRMVLVDLQLCHPPSARSCLPSSPCRIFQSSSVLILSLNFASSVFHQHDPAIYTSVISRKRLPLSLNLKEFHRQVYPAKSLFSQQRFLHLLILFFFFGRNWATLKLIVNSFILTDPNIC